MTYPSFDEIYTIYYRRSVLLVLHYVHDVMASEDIVSDVMLKLWDKMQSIDVISVEALLFHMLRNESLNYIKHEKIRYEKEQLISLNLKREIDYRISLFSDLPDFVELKEINDLTAKALSELSEKTQQIYYLSRSKNFKNKEIASMLNLSIKTVEYHLNKAKQKLQAELKDYIILFLVFYFYCS